MLSIPKFYAHLSESYFKVSKNSVSVLVLYKDHEERQQVVLKEWYQKPVPGIV
jgi:hypothetical protein